MYHITESPAILSGEIVAFSDPQKLYLNEKGRRWNFLKNNLENIQDQLAPLKLFGM